MILLPKIVSIDTSLLNSLSKDYLSPIADLRAKARKCLLTLKESGIYIAFSTTHLTEFWGHGDSRVARDRRSFLCDLPLIAWIRPFDRNWFPGSFVDICSRELLAFTSLKLETWESIISQVRDDLWETGCGHEMFSGNNRIWDFIEAISQNRKPKEQYIASIARTDAGSICDVKFSEIVKLPIRPKEQRLHYLNRFRDELRKQLGQHGDKRLPDALEAANSFTRELNRDFLKICDGGPDEILKILDKAKVPLSMIDENTTVGDIGDLAIYARRLELFSEKLRCAITIEDVPIDSLPSYALERKLWNRQNEEPRISGSNFGDTHLAAMSMYVDAIQVDKRTNSFLDQIIRKNSKYAQLAHNYFCCKSYEEIPVNLDRIFANKPATLN